MHNQLKNRTKKSSATKRTLSFVLMLSMIISMMIPALGFSAAAADIGKDVVLMSLTRDTATAAEAGNQFTANYGIFADVSSLTAWSNNTQKAVGGTGRTPIVFNNAQTTGGWKPVSVAGLDNADAFQIKFSTLGYENIRFTCRQKSTGSGPDAFLLAYSVNGPTGPYTIIENSATGTNGIPAISRMSNDTYAALRDSYDSFLLPAEIENEAEVYLRVVFNGLTNLGANGNTSINDIVIVGDEAETVTIEPDVSLMTLTRETATAAEAGNLFRADSGVFANVSNLTAWSNNTQKAVGGTGRTPIVFNNAQTTGGWKPISVAGVDNADAFQIKFSTLGYENIRFTCRQKSTGSGPDEFLLAYSVGSPTGPYTIIENSVTGTNGIPAISRMSNDTYAALRDSYDNFLLPAEMENEAEVYLRVVFNGLTNLGANGNTSINDIVIIGDGASGGNTVVDKSALNALIMEASQKIESDYVAATWAVFADAYQNAIAVAGDNNVTRQEVNSARIRLQTAMNALVLLVDYIPVIAWPGSSTLTAWDTARTFLADSSGLDFHNGQLFAVDNGTGRFWILDVALDGTMSFAPGFPSAGRRVNFKSRTSSNGPDAEGITVDGDGFVYIASERDNSRNQVNWNVILQIDPRTPGTGTIIATLEWDITSSLPNVDTNTGIEAVEWVANEDVAGKLWDKNTNTPFNPSNYPNAIADGVFFVALEANGFVYAYVLNQDETYVQIAVIDSKLGGAMALDYDTYEGVLWVAADNGFGNRAAILTFTGTPSVNIVHVNPPTGLNLSGNYEGFAIAEARYTVNGQRPVYRFEDGVSSRALTIGSIDCDYNSVVSVDKTALAAAIESASAKVEAEYTADTWAAFAAAFTSAQQVYADVNATQAQVDAAVNALNSATGALVPSYFARPALDAASDTGAMTYLGSYWSGETNADGGVAEIVAYNKDNQKMYIVSGAIQALDIVSLAGISAGTSSNTLTLEKRIDIAKIAEANNFVAGDMTSVSVNTRLKVIAVSVQHDVYSENGCIVFLDYDGNYIAHYEAGVQPDMIGFTPDGNYVMTANEGEPRMGYGAGAVDPEGSVTIIDLTGINSHEALKNLDPQRVVTVGFHAFDSVRAQLVADLVLLKPDTAPSVDLEPEYIAFSEDSRTAYVSLQEANAVATFDIASKTFTSVKGLGFKDHGLPGNEIDINPSGPIDIKLQPNVYGVYMPDGLATINIGGVQYVLTPNEGDSRSDWLDYDDVQRSGSLPVNGIGNVEHIINAERDILKDRPEDTFLLGARSFSIWRADDMSQVFDSGSDFETITARMYPDNFNSNHAAANYKGRGGRKGPEPEDIKVMQIGSRYYAFIGLERIGGLMMYDITDPENAYYVDYLNVRDFSNSNLANGSDLGAEGIYVIPAEDSPTGYPMVLVANEVSGSVTVIQINAPEPKSYTVKFVDFDGTVLSEHNVEHGKAAAAPADPARAGYTFTGWDNDFSKITGNMTVTAQYSQNAAVTLVNATTNAKGFISITETAKNSRVWTLKFDVVETYSDGTSKTVTHSLNLNGNNANLDGKYTFTDGSLKGYTLVYDIKGNGSNIKEFRLVK